jgi:ubiquinone biosynthesis protein
MMDLKVKPAHIKRYKDIAKLLIKYGRSDLVSHSGWDEPEAENRVTATEITPKAEELAADLERMGPTFVKLGQLLSARPGLLPVPYIKALARLQDEVEPFPYEEVENIFVLEIGIRISKAFLEFDPSPFAAASLGQVHRACLKDGRPVAVKIQRPGIRRRIVEDIEILMQIAEILDHRTQVGERFEFQKMLDEFRKSIMRELDYRQEARNLKTLASNLSDFNQIVVPLPIEDFTTSHVLTMEFIQGKKITSLTSLAKLELQGSKLAEEVFQAYLKQVLVDGFFHADPHPGNLFLTDDARIALLDLGMVGRTSPHLQEKLVHLVRAISDGRHEDAADLATQIGEKRPRFDLESFRQGIAELTDKMNVDQIDVGTAMMEFAQIAGEAGLRLPSELTMLAKTLLNLDKVAHMLDPEFDPNASIRTNIAKIMRMRLLRGTSSTSIFGRLLEIKELLDHLPHTLGMILERFANNDLQVKIDAIDEKYLMNGLQKIANRITLGLVLAALIVGAAMLMTVPTEFRILGYPGLAIIFFLAAAGGGVALVLDILFYDERPSKR